MRQSFAGWFCEPVVGSQPAPLLRDPLRGASRTIAALRHVETEVVCRGVHAAMGHVAGRLPLGFA